jgi:hypothetical protein
MEYLREVLYHNITQNQVVMSLQVKIQLGKVQEQDSLKIEHEELEARNLPRSSTSHSNLNSNQPLTS